MRRIVLIFLIFWILLVLQGCGSSKSGPSGTQLVDADFRKGTESLKISFLKNAPPDKIFEQSTFPIGIHIQNKGAHDVQFGLLSIGLEREFASLQSEITPLQLDIEGRSALNTEGGEQFVTVNAKAKKIGAQSETHPTTIFATACYQYKTILAASVCVDTDLYGLANREKVCTAKDETFSSQGGPVAITKIESRILPSEEGISEFGDARVIPHFIIHVENKGKGEVINPDYGKVEDACSNRPLRYTDFNRIKVSARLTRQELNCRVGDSGESILRLRDKKDVIRCILEEGILKDSDPFTAPLQIELEYGYTFTTSKSIIIEKILTY